MARLRNNTFSGSPISDVDPDQLTYKRVVANAIGDTALIEDILTGDHTPPTNSTINHAGLVGSLYRGCPLGVPLIQCVWPRAGGFGGGPSMFCSNAGDSFIALIPFRLPRGETRIDVVVDSDTEAAVVAEVYSTSMALVSRGFVTPTGELDTLRGTVAGLTGGTTYVFGLRVNGGVDGQTRGSYFNGLFVGFPRMAKTPLLFLNPPAFIDALAGSPFTVPTTTVVDAGGNAAVMRLTAFDEALVADNVAISSYHLSRLNQTQNALEEHLTGMPCAGNESFALLDSDNGAVNPTTTAFHDHSQAGRVNEALVDVPVWAEPWGGILVTGAIGGFGGTWEPPQYVNNVGAKLFFLGPNLMIPDAPNNISDSVLTVLIVACSPNGHNITGMTVEVKLVGPSSPTTSAGFVQMGATKFYLCTIPLVRFNADQLNRLEISVQDVNADVGTSGDFCMLGGCAYLVGT